MMALLASSVAFASSKEATVITYPAPQTEKVFCQYVVTVNGNPVDIYQAFSPQHNRHAGGEYYFCSFDFEGEVEVVVKSRTGWGLGTMYVVDPAERKRLQETLISDVYPPKIKAERTLKHVKFKQNKPFQAIVMRNGIIMPLMIFGNPIDKNPPKKSDPNVVYFDAGVHYLDKPLVLKDNQTLYLAGGSVLKFDGPQDCVFMAKDAKNVSVRGRGIISFDNRGRYMYGGLLFKNCKNLLIEGIIVRDGNRWICEMFNCDNVQIDNFKICSSRMINDDALDICNSKNITIKNTFCRVQDDVIAIKGMPDVPNADKLPVENIYIENCIFWSDAANTFRIGYECNAPYFKNIKCKEIYVPFYSDYIKPDLYWSHAIVWLQPTSNMCIEDFEIDGLHIRSNGKDMPLLLAEPRVVHCSKDYGTAKNCTIKNVVVEGKKGKFRGEVWLRGQSEKYKITDITVENAVYFGKKKTADDKDVFIGNFTENINIFKK